MWKCDEWGDNATTVGQDLVNCIKLAITQSIDCQKTAHRCIGARFCGPLQAKLRWCHSPKWPSRIPSPTPSQTHRIRKSWKLLDWPRRVCCNFRSWKKSPTGPSECTAKPEYLIALATYLGVRCEGPIQFLKKSSPKQNTIVVWLKIQSQVVNSCKNKNCHRIAHAWTNASGWLFPSNLLPLSFFWASVCQRVIQKLRQTILLCQKLNQRHLWPLRGSLQGIWDTQHFSVHLETKNHM